MAWWRNRETNQCGWKCSICGKFKATNIAGNFCHNCVEERPDDCDNWLEHFRVRVERKLGGQMGNR